VPVISWIARNVLSPLVETYLTTERLAR
jgi:hypothetical protein